MRLLLAAAALGALLTTTSMAGDAFGAGPRPTAADITAEDRASMREALAEVEFYAFLMKEFPAEYTPLETALILDFKSGKRVGVDTSAVVARLNAELRPFVPQAPDGEIAALTRKQVSVMKALQKASDRACYEFGEGGISAGAVDGLPDEVVAAVASSGIQVMRVGVAGRKARIKREAPTPTEMAKVVEAYRAAGGDIEFMQALAEKRQGDFAPKARCSNTILWMEAIASQPPAVVARIAAMP